ncbi:hypothetical protein B6V73_18070 [Thioclava sp. JM3]|uniref:hypothetical protein n=1 Tax=Thioclava sp. JM3 TaxID=1973004 RepID=UPI000B53AD8F|nr:hypothetical protein [Thioclava sp. JM3]OWY12887.1 hypothetical protein B6V73_18070 [Thioclava sp. JM3]
MNELHDKDWEQVNAYHDGELCAADLHAFEGRLASEPALAAALEDVRNVSDSLAALRPSLVQSASALDTSSANSNWHPRRLLAVGAVAAAIALAVAFGPAFDTTPTAFEIHAELAAEAFDVESAELRSAAAGGAVGIPDLSVAHLTAVFFRTSDNGEIVHYAGQNGCRLTYFRGTFVSPEGNDTPGQQMATWLSKDQLRYMIVATGMDRTRFDAIASYLKLETSERASESVMASLSETIRTARSCVG